MFESLMAGKSDITIPNKCIMEEYKLELLDSFKGNSSINSNFLNLMFNFNRLLLIYLIFKQI